MNRKETQAEDMQAVKAFQSGDRSAFDRLVACHRDRIFNLCLWFLADYQEADDMAQETFIKAYRGLKNFRGQSGFFTWLYRIAVNTCKNRLGSLEYRFKRRFRHLEPYDDLKDALAMTVPGNSPARDLEAKERAAMVRQAIQGLPRDKKTVIILRDMEGLRYDEIASLTGLKIGTVKSKLARARKDLKSMLEGIIQ